MKFATLKYLVLSWASGLTIFIIVLMPFHAFLTVFGSSIVGHYEALRLWKEVLLVVCSLFTLFLLATDKKMRELTLNRRLVWAIFAYIFLVLICGLVAWNRGAVTPLAFGYGIISDLRFLAFFLITWLVSLRLSRLHSHWQWMVLWPATFVVVFGILQFTVLPHDFLSHFGYGPKTISPYETINNNIHYVRIMSTLRGANPLGAYLVIPITMLSVLLIKKRIQKRQIILLLLALVCLFFSFSRSAWIGAVISLGIVGLVCIKTHKARQIALAGIAGVLLVFAGSAAVFHNNSHFQNVFLHTQTNSAAKQSSDQGHTAALESGLKDIWHHPLGGGTGTAGPASVYNGHCPARIAENYFLQIGQETGVIGLVLFIIINLGVGYLLWLRRDDPLALSLFASLIGLTFINMLSLAWTDDTLAYIWWGLAGIAMAPNLKKIRQDAAAKK